MDKSELRRIHLDKQRNLSSLERTQKSESIAEKFFAHFDLTEIDFLHCFLPIEKFAEIDTTLIFHRIWREFPQLETFAPRINFQTNEIENVRFTARTKLTENVWQIREPVGVETIAAQKIDLVLIPLLAFDRRGHRVGYGKGFYDKFLNRGRPDCLKIGLSYFAPVSLIADRREFDVKLDFCVAPDAILRF